MKLISAVAATLALAVSMLLGPSTATAAPGAYPGSISTYSSLRAPSPQGPHHITVWMRVQAGNARPTGHLRLRLYKRTASGSYRLIRNPYLTYAGGLRRFTFWRLARGIYRVNYRYIPPSNSVFRSSVSPTRTVRVTG